MALQVVTARTREHAANRFWARPSGADMAHARAMVADVGAVGGAELAALMAREGTASAGWVAYTLAAAAREAAAE